jgi:uncharacterized coiled-coil DUF342 family protein
MGDTLDDLNQRRHEAERVLREVRERRDAAAASLKTLDEACDAAESGCSNISARLNAWWVEFRAFNAKRG